MNNLIDDLLEGMFSGEPMEFDNTPNPDYENYSANEINAILYSLFDKKGPVQLKEISEDDYKKIPLYNLCAYYLRYIEKEGEMKLTAKNYLPAKLVTALYNQGYKKDLLIELSKERKELKMIREMDSESIHLTRTLCNIAGLAKLRKGKISLTAKGKKLINYPNQWFHEVLLGFATRFNWAYFDGYGENYIGQFAVGYSIIMVSKYGAEWKDNYFYSGKYFTAFPNLIDDPGMEGVRSSVEYSSDCYSIRTFNRFLDYIGVIESDLKHVNFGSAIRVKKNELFDKVFKVLPPIELTS
jgi:hypothetical protein